MTRELPSSTSSRCCQSFLLISSDASSLFTILNASCCVTQVSAGTYESVVGVGISMTALRNICFASIQSRYGYMHPLATVVFAIFPDDIAACEYHPAAKSRKATGNDCVKTYRLEVRHIIIMILIFIV